MYSYLRTIQSIDLNGGYVDDLDLGEEIIYTGHGGNDPNSKKQISDQSWDATGNKALIVTEMHGLPLRVTRGLKHKSPLSPATGYQYGGLYKVTDYFEEKGKDGFTICRFRLEKLTPLSPKQLEVRKSLPKGSEETTRTETTVLRIVRDTKLSQEVKKLYDYACQVCGIQISVRGVKYAEGAHIRPLGKPHNGKDIPGNLLCLCPNHHVMLDMGAFAIADDLELIGIEGRLQVKSGHVLDRDNARYHQEHVFIS